MEGLVITLVLSSLGVALILFILGRLKRRRDDESASVANPTGRKDNSLAVDRNISLENAGRASSQSMSSERMWTNIDAYRAKHKTHTFLLYSCGTFSHHFLTAVYPTSWTMAGNRTYYCIPWIEKQWSRYRPLGGSLSWVDSPYSLHDVLQNSDHRAGINETLSSAIKEYFKVNSEYSLIFKGYWAQATENLRSC